MKKLLALAFFLFTTPVWAQGGNPQCPTRPPGDNTNACASTAFVQTAVGGGGGLPALPQNYIYIGSTLNVAVAQPMSGDCTIIAAGAITCTKTNGTAFGYFATGTDASNLSGTVNTARLSGTYGGINGTGTLGAGSTGTGFTIAAGTSTWTGTVPAANGGAGTINGILKANGTGIVSAAAAGTDYVIPTTNLTNLLALGSTGFPARSGASTWATRTITGTASQITVTNGDGSAGNPTISLPSAMDFTGITVSNGTWNTGVINATSIAIGGVPVGTSTSSYWSIVGGGPDIQYSAGNVGIGVNPSAWGGISPLVLQIGRASFASVNSTSASVWYDNVYYDGTVNKYIANGFASGVTNGGSSAGNWAWYTAPSGTAGATAAFVSRMELSNTGVLTLDSYGAGIANFSSAGLVSSQPGYTKSVIYAADAPCSVVAGLGSGSPQDTQLKCALDLSAANNAKPVELPCGQIYVSTTLTPTTAGLAVSMHGCNPTGQAAYTNAGSTLITTSGFTTGDVIYVSSDTAVDFGGFGIDATTQRTSGAAIHLAVNVGSVNQNSTVRSLTLNKQYNGILCTQCGNPLIEHNVITNFKGWGIYADHGGHASESSMGRIHQNTITGLDFGGAGNDGNLQATSLGGIYTEVGYVWMDTNGIGNVQTCVQVSPRLINAGNVYVTNNSCENTTNNGFLFQTADNSNASIVWVSANHCFVDRGTYVATHFVCVYFSASGADHSWIEDVSVDKNVSLAAITTNTHYNIQAGTRLTFTENKAATEGGGSSENCFTFTTYIAAETIASNNQCTGPTYPTRMYSSNVGLRFTDPVGVPFANLPIAGNGSDIFVTDGQQTSSTDQAIKAGGSGVPGKYFLGAWRTLKY